MSVDAVGHTYGACTCIMPIQFIRLLVPLLSCSITPTPTQVACEKTIGTMLAVLNRTLKAAQGEPNPHALFLITNSRLVGNAKVVEHLGLIMAGFSVLHDASA